MSSFRSVCGLAKLVHFVGWKAELPVLRITPAKQQDRAGLILDGRLEGPWVEILNNSWRQAMTAEGSVLFVTQPLLHLMLRGCAIVPIVFISVERKDRGNNDGDHDDDGRSHRCTNCR